MKNVSNTWNYIQGKEVRPKTDVKGHFVGKQAKPYYCRNGKLSRNNNIKFLLNDAFAFKCKGYDPSNPSYYQVDYFFDEAVEITPSKLKFMFFGILNENNLLIGLNDVNNLVPYSTIKNSNTPVSCQELSFSISYNVATTGEWGLYYCELNGNGVDITSDEIKQLSYKAHVDVLNKDLPYHKIDLQTLKLYSPNDIQCALFFVGYPSINEYVFLGCGYYYLQEYKKQGINQILKFVDCLSTMTNLYCYSFPTQVSGYAEPSFVIRWATHYHASFGLNATGWRSWLPTYNFQNVDYSSAKLTSVGRFIPRGNKSCAETLQKVALAYGLTLYVNGENQIVFEDLQAKSHIYDSNKLWLMKSPKNDDLDKVGTLTRQSYKVGTYDSGKVLYQQDSGEVIENADRILVLDESYAYGESLQINGHPSVSTGNGTFNTVKFVESQNVAITITNTVYNLTLCDRSKTTVFSGSDVNYNVVIDTVGLNEDAHLGIDYAVYWLNRMGNYGKTSINVRLDPKYDVCDILNNEKYGEFVVCDINATYNGAYSGSLSGVARLPFIEAPIVSDIQTNNGCLECDIFNPNDKELELTIGNLPLDVEHTMTIKPFETIHYDSYIAQDDDVNVEIAKYGSGVLFDDIFARFSYADVYDGTTKYSLSENTIIVKHNNVEIGSPAFSVIHLDADDDFEIEFENEYDYPVNLVIWYDNQTKTKVVRMEAGTLLNLDDGNFAELGIDVETYIDARTGDSPFCYFETLDGLVRSQAKVLFELEHSRPMPPILRYKYIYDNYLFGFELINSNADDLDLSVVASAGTITIAMPENSDLLLDQSYPEMQDEVNQYINEALEGDVVCYLSNEYGDSNNTILLERNN